MCTCHTSMKSVHSEHTERFENFPFHYALVSNASFFFFNIVILIQHLSLITALSGWKYCIAYPITVLIYRHSQVGCVSHFALSLNQWVWRLWEERERFTESSYRNWCTCPHAFEGLWQQLHSFFFKIKSLVWCFSNIKITPLMLARTDILSFASRKKQNIWLGISVKQRCISVHVYQTALVTLNSFYARVSA